MFTAERNKTNTLPWAVLLSSRFLTLQTQMSAVQNYFLGLVLFSLCLGAWASTGFQLKVEPKTEDCFYKDFNQGSRVDFEWHVLDGGLLDVDVKVWNSFYIFIYNWPFSMFISWMCCAVFLCSPNSWPLLGLPRTLKDLWKTIFWRKRLEPLLFCDLGDGHLCLLFQ